MKKKIEEYYVKNKDQQIKRMTYRAGSKEDAEDVIQIAYANAYEWRRSFNPDMDFDRWFRRILNNALKRYKRYQKGSSLDEVEEEGYEQIMPHMTRLEIIKEIDKCGVNNQGTDVSQILDMYFNKDLKPSEICAVVDINLPNCKQIINRFKLAMNKKYQ